MYDFEIMMNTKIYFGKRAVTKLSAILQELNKENIMLMCGIKSAKNNGSYNEVKKQLEDVQQKYIEFLGVEQNTLLCTVRDAIRIGKQNKIGAIIAIGGGSVIDCAKWVATGCKTDKDIWELVIKPQEITATLPVVAIITLSASGSETDSFSVMYNLDEKKKVGVDSKYFRPFAAIMNPEYTYTVNEYQTGCGIADIISHVIENMCVKEVGKIQENLGIAILKTCFESGEKLIEDPENYEARANIMLAGNWAINGLISAGRKGGWILHPIEHYLGCYYNIAHGEGMAILVICWLRFLVYCNTVDILILLGREIWKLDIRDEKKICQSVIYCIKNFFEGFGLPISLVQLGITDVNFEVIAERVVDELKDTYISMRKEDIVQLLYISLDERINSDGKTTNLYRTFNE